jgi:o-succinylbenzoate synthase
MIELSYKKYDLIFRNPAGTSRGILKTKTSWIFILKDSEKPNKIFHGECSLIQGLSPDDSSLINDIMNEICIKVNNSQLLDNILIPEDFPAIKFGFEMLILDYNSEKEKLLFNSDFTLGKAGIPINGLIWMADKNNMFSQIKNKLDSGWNCIKLKIGAIDFNSEIELLKYIREQYSVDHVEIRLDANGAFKSEDALNKLNILSDFTIHSIEQPIKQGNIEKMSELCEISPIPIALDEELIGVASVEKFKLLDTIKSAYIVLKPSLLGGFKESQEWTNIASSLNIEYWITSALESNIGLNAIAQWTATLPGNKTHGLGTGMLYTNNFISPLNIKDQKLFYNISESWEINI